MSTKDSLNRLFDALEPTLKKREAAAVMGISTQTLQRLIDEGAVPAYKPGRDWVLFAEDVKDYMRTRRNPDNNNESTQ